MDNTGVTGEHLSSEGKKGDAVVGDARPVDDALASIDRRTADHASRSIDHPQNPGFPTYWHARGYGLFAANPLGQKIFQREAARR